MADWEHYHGWMSFDALDVSEGLTRSFTIGYRFTDNAADRWTARFNRFKAKRRPAVRGSLNVLKTAVPRLIGALGLDRARTVLVPALSSKETVARKNGMLPAMARMCASAAKVGFICDPLTKKAHPPLHTVYDADERQALLDSVNYRSAKIAARNVLVLDDFITRGDTLSHIARALRAANPHVRVYGIGVAKTERQSYFRRYFDIEISNDHIPAVWNRLWIAGEQQ